ncbi:MAG: thioredoxin [Candidatus ainarchaeum sp.]|nr:thioredoxin [Candidatus ainarchaeum sp.]
MQVVDDSSFRKEVLESKLPVLVDFYAEWCPPCKVYGPAFERAAAKTGGKIKFVKLDVDKAPDVARECGVMSIPTTILFKEGKQAASFVGAMGDSELEKWLGNNVR